MPFLHVFPQTESFMCLSDDSFETEALGRLSQEKSLFLIGKRVKMLQISLQRL